MGRDHDDGEAAGVSLIIIYFVDDIGPPSRGNVDFPVRSTLSTAWDALIPGDHGVGLPRASFPLVLSSST